MARLLVVPWSIARMYVGAMIPPMFPVCVLLFSGMMIGTAENYCQPLPNVVM
jgi:hypothetical protein